MDNRKSNHDGHHAVSHPLEARMLAGIDRTSQALSQRVESVYSRLDDMQDDVKELAEKITSRGEDLWKNVTTFMDRPQRRAMAWSFIGGLLTGVWLMRRKE